MTGPAVAAADVVIRPAAASKKEPVPDVSVPGGTIGDGADANGWLALGFDPSVVGTLSTLYGEWTSGLRELYANLVASCKRAASEYGADPTIVITIDGRTVQLEDADSCGMSRMVFRDGIAVAGNTGNDDPRSPGQWGLGSLSFVMMADEMLIESYSRATGEKFSVRALRGGKFVLGGGEDSLPEPSLGSYGTRMTLRLRDGLEVKDAIDTAVKISEMSGVRTILRLHRARMAGERGVDGIRVDGILVDGLEDPLYSLNGLDAVHEAPYRVDGGVALILGGGGGQCDLRGAVAAKVRRAGYDVGGGEIRPGGSHWGRDNTCLLADGGGVVIVHAENDDLGVAAALCIESASHRSRWSYRLSGSHLHRAWLAGMPIRLDTDPYSLSDFSAVFAHFKNERVYRPTPDRERLTDESEKHVDSDIAALVMYEISKVRFATLGECLSDYGNRIVEASTRMSVRNLGVRRRDMSPPMQKWLDGLPLETRRRLGWAPQDKNAPVGVGVAGDREMKIALAASAPIKVFGSAAAGDRHTLWSAVRCGAGDGAGAHPDSCRMAAGRETPEGGEPVLIVAKTLQVRKAAAVADWCAKNMAGRRVVVFRPDKDSPYSVDDYASLGAEPIDEYMARHGIKPLSVDKARAASGRAVERASLMVYGGDDDGDDADSGGDGDGRTRGGYRRQTDARRKIDPISAGERIVWCDNTDDMDAMKAIVTVLPCHAQAAKCRRRPGTATPFADYAAAGRDATYATTSGRLSGSAIARTGRRIVMVAYDGDAADLADLMRTAAAKCGIMRWPRGHGGNRRYVHLPDDPEERRQAKLDWLPPMIVVGTASELSACAAWLHASAPEARYGAWMPGGAYANSERVQRMDVRPNSYLGDDACPDWIGSLGGHSVRSNESRTLVAAALHGHLANMYRRGPRVGVGNGAEDAGNGTDGRSD